MLAACYGDGVGCLLVIPVNNMAGAGGLTFPDLHRFIKKVVLNFRSGRGNGLGPVDRWLYDPGIINGAGILNRCACLGNRPIVIDRAAVCQGRIFGQNQRGPFGNRQGFSRIQCKIPVQREGSIHGCSITNPNQTIRFLRVVQLVVLHLHDAAGDLDLAVVAEAERPFSAFTGSRHMAAGDGNDSAGAAPAAIADACAAAVVVMGMGVDVAACDDDGTDLAALVRTDACAACFSTSAASAGDIQRTLPGKDQGGILRNSDSCLCLSGLQGVCTRKDQNHLRAVLQQDSVAAVAACIDIDIFYRDGMLAAGYGDGVGRLPSAGNVVAGAGVGAAVANGDGSKIDELRALHIKGACLACAAHIDVDIFEGNIVGAARYSDGIGRFLPVAHDLMAPTGLAAVADFHRTGVDELLALRKLDGVVACDLRGQFPGIVNFPIIVDRDWVGNYACVVDGSGILDAALPGNRPKIRNRAIVCQREACGDDNLRLCGDGQGFS